MGITKVFHKVVISNVLGDQTTIVYGSESAVKKWAIREVGNYGAIHFAIPDTYVEVPANLGLKVIAL